MKNHPWFFEVLVLLVTIQFLTRILIIIIKFLLRTGTYIKLLYAWIISVVIYRCGKLKYKQPTHRFNINFEEFWFLSDETSEAAEKVAAEENSILKHGEQFADYLKKGLSDNWSQVNSNLVSNELIRIKFWPQ